MELDELRKIIKKMTQQEARVSGNPYSESSIDRELANAGIARKPEDIPKQDVSFRGVVKPNNLGATFRSSTLETGGVYKLGPAKRPQIYHDSGFSKFAKQDATLSDYWQLFKWKSKMIGASALRPDLVDGIASYSHFLNGKGKPRIFSYERYIMNDNSGRLTLRNAILDAQDAAISLWESNGRPKKFNFTGPAIPCGSGGSKYQYLSKAFPYPATENWQKAIGAHVIWLSGEVTVTQRSRPAPQPEFKMQFTLHAEDQYNFNPGAKDIKTGTPDSANGRFVVVGFAHGYRNNASLKRSFSWIGTQLGVASMGVQKQQRHKPPKINRG